MHCELLLPALLSAPAEARLPSLELLLARARASTAPAVPAWRWLLDAFRADEGEEAKEVEGEAAPVGALTLYGEGGEAGDALWARADPVHLRLMRDRLIMVPSPAFALSEEEAKALTDSLNRHFQDQMAFHAVRPEQWCVRFAEPVELQPAPSPLEAAGRDADLTRLRGYGRSAALMNEAQMLLHSHPVNEAREARGEPAINSVWLWGAGHLPPAGGGHWISVTAEDPVARGLARLAGVRHRRLPATAGEWLARAPEEGRHLVVLDALLTPFALSETAAYQETLQAMERDWFAPLLGALRNGRLGMLTLQIPDAAESLSFETIRGDLRRFWRRPKALERYA
jgi:hypothetical protein